MIYVIHYQYKVMPNAIETLSTSWISVIEIVLFWYYFFKTNCMWFFLILSYFVLQHDVWSWSKQSIEQLFHRFINNFLFEQLINQISYTKKLIKKSSALGKAELVKSDAFKHRILKKMLWDRMLNKYLLGAIMWTKSPNVKSIK